jgi:hypothetical protein
MSDDELRRDIVDLARRQDKQAEADKGPDDALWLADERGEDGLGAEETAEVPPELDERAAEEEVLAEVVDFQAARERRTPLSERREAPAPAPAPRLQGGWLGWLGLAAAVLVLVLLSRPQIEPLGAYALTVLEAPETARGEAEPLQLRVGERFTLLARPASEVRGQLDATLWLVREGRWLRLPAVVEVSEQGEVRLQGELIDAALRGEAELVVTVGRAGALTHDAGAAVDGEALRVLRMPVVVRAAR